MTEAVRYVVGGVIIAIIILIIALVSTSLKKLASDEGMYSNKKSSWLFYVLLSGSNGGITKLSRASHGLFPSIFVSLAAISTGLAKVGIGKNGVT